MHGAIRTGTVDELLLPVFKQMNLKEAIFKMDIQGSEANAFAGTHRLFFHTFYVFFHGLNYEHLKLDYALVDEDGQKLYNCSSFYATG